MGSPYAFFIGNDVAKVFFDTTADYAFSVEAEQLAVLAGVGALKGLVTELAFPDHEPCFPLLYLSPVGVQFARTDYHMEQTCSRIPLEKGCTRTLARATTHHFVKLCDILKSLHAAHIAHRDICLSNCFVHDKNGTELKAEDDRVFK